MEATQFRGNEIRHTIDAACPWLAEATATRFAEPRVRLVADSTQVGTVERDKRSEALESASSGRATRNVMIGRRVGTYLVTERLGAGGSAEVFKGIDVMLKRDVAIKVLRAEIASGPGFPERFRREAQIVAGLSHPHIASVYAFLNEGDEQFMVMEYVPGMSLDAFIRGRGPVPAEQAMSIFRPVLAGIGHAHKCGIVHRDLKPANIMLTQSGQVKVLDFGIARAVGSDHLLTRHGQVPGTARYMSPEQVRGEEVDARSDIYSLGVVLYMLLCGRAPFVGQSVYEVMKSQVEQTPPPLHTLVTGVPLPLEAAVMRALAKNPADRFQSVEAFRRALDKCLAETVWSAPVTQLNPSPSRGPAAKPAPLVHGPDTQRTQIFRPVADSRERADPGRSIAAAARVRPALLAWLRGTDRRIVALLGLVPLVAGAALALPPVMRSEASADVWQSHSSAAAIAEEKSQPQREDNASTPALVITRLPVGPGATEKFRPGERVQLQIKPSRDAYVYCYLQDEAARIVRFFPNRFRKSALVTAEAPLQVPGTMGFEIVANAMKVKETVACFATERDVMAELPQAVTGTDFASLQVASLVQVTAAFAAVAGHQLAEAKFAVEFD